MADGQTAVNPQTGERIVLRNGQWVAAGAPAASVPTMVQVPVPSATAQRNVADIGNINSQITSRGVGDVNTNANTAETVVDTNKKRLELQSALEARARGVVVEDQATQELRNQLQAVRNARQYVNNFSTGSIGALVGDPKNSEGNGGSGLADLPGVGGALYAGTDRAALNAALGTVRSGAKFNMIQTLKERGAAQGSQGTGLGATAIPEFEALGRVNFNLEPDSLAAGSDFVNGELSKAEETLLRRYAAVALPSSVLVNATPEERKQLLEASYKQAVAEYQNNFQPPAAGGQGGGNGGGGAPMNGKIATGKERAVADPALSGVDGTVKQMIRNGASSADIVNFISSRGIPTTTDLISSVQANTEIYRPYVGKKLPATLPEPVVDLERKMEPLSLREQVSGALADSSIGAGLIGSANGFLLGGLDEVAGMGDPKRTAELDAMKRYLGENYGKSYTAGNIAGGAASFIPVGRGVSLGLKGLGAGARAVAAGATAADVALGATSCALENNQDRKAGALTGSLFALGGDLAGKYIGGKLAGRLADQPTGAERAIADSVTDPAANAGILTQADALGVPMSLADSSPALRNLAGQAVRNSEEAGVLADNAIGGRDLAQTKRAIATVEQTLAKETNVAKAANTLRGRGSAAADPYYQAAYGRVGVATDADLQAILNRPAVQEGLKNAQRAIANRGRDAKELGFSINKNGRLTVSKNATFEALDLAKRGIDDHLDTFRDDFGRLTTNDSTRAIIDARDALVSRMRELNPDYAAALDTYAPFAKNAEALTMGGKAITATKATPAQLSEIVSSMDPDQLANYQVGAANAIINKIKKSKDNRDAFSVFRDEDMRQRLAAVFPDKADELANLKSVTDLEGVMRRTKESLLGGSATQGRQVAQEAFAAQANAGGGALANAAAEAGAAYATGGVSLLPSLVRNGVLSFKNANKLQAVKNQEALGRDLAPILMETDPKKAKQALEGILAKVSKYDSTKATARRVGGSAGAAAATGILTQ